MTDRPGELRWYGPDGLSDPTPGELVAAVKHLSVEPDKVGGDLPNWSPRQPERIEDLKRAREARPGRWAPWERDLAFLVEFYEAALAGRVVVPTEGSEE